MTTKDEIKLDDLIEEAQQTINYSPKQFEIWQLFKIVLDQGYQIKVEKKVLLQPPPSFLDML